MIRPCTEPVIGSGWQHLAQGPAGSCLALPRNRQKQPSLARVLAGAEGSTLGEEAASVMVFKVLADETDSRFLSGFRPRTLRPGSWNLWSIFS